MKAMVLAAGLGTRLRPLTDDRPKALVELGGRTMLELTLERLRNAGVTDVVVNTHHFAELMQTYIESRDWGMRVEISYEPLLLDTGGGLKNAARFFQRDGLTEPFLLHNVDVLSGIDLAKMIEFHRENQALATLAVQRRESSRLLLFDKGVLCGRIPSRGGDPEPLRPFPNAEAFAFSGIHVLSPRLLWRISEKGVFSIIDVYLRLAAAGEKILSFPEDGFYWRDLGKPQSVEQAARDIADGVYRA